MSTFIDAATIHVESGKGGDGMVHFRREKYVPRGGPDGGDGGSGGDVILQVDPHLNTLFHFRHQSRYRAPDGGNGGTSKKTGKSAAALFVPVPPGTLAYDDETGDLLGDLTLPGQQLTVCAGGRGGRGNPHFRNSRNQAPRIGEKGEPGQARTLRLELKLIADIGLVGAPNAGKSTLLAAITNAKPKIAPYPFTTLVPNLGVAVLDPETSLIVADIPGLIEGAHIGVGLGHEFLRHIQRTRVLIHLLDGLAQDPLADYSQINTELALFDPALADKPQIVVFNKIDLPDAAARWDAVRKALQKKGCQPHAISAVAHTNVRQMLYAAHQALAAAPLPPPAEEIPVYRYQTDPNDYQIERVNANAYRISGAAIERAAAMTYWEHDQSRRRFQRILETIGIDGDLRAAGIQPGDTVLIGEYQLEWEE
jgi:GTP-binding protein